MIELLPAEMIFATVFVFLSGACVGSFLNVCIYRIPRDESVVAPRSHCPHCDRLIAWFDNIPLLSYFILRAKCRHCGERITPRYVLVEFLVAVLFLGVWLRFGIDPRTPVYLMMMSGLVLGTFVDFEHLIIPDRVSIGGIVAGLVLSPLIPSLHNVTSGFEAFTSAVIGLAVGFGLLWVVAGVGKLVFGRKRIVCAEPEMFKMTDEEDNVSLVIGERRWENQDLFPDEADRWLLECDTCLVNGEPLEKSSVELLSNGLQVGERFIPWDDIESLEGTLKAFTYPRDAMGFGDVKLLGGIGALLGWEAVLFTVMVSSVLGATVGVVLIGTRRREWLSKIPYGPYLALGAVVWILCGSLLWDWYVSLMTVSPY